MFMDYHRDRENKTTPNILSILAKLEKKFDDHLVDQNISSVTSPLKDSNSLFPTSHSTATAGVYSKFPDHSSSSKLQQAVKYQRGSYKVMMWPGVIDCLTSSGAKPALNLKSLLQEGMPWFVREGTNMSQSSLPSNPGLTSLQVGKAPSDEGRKLCVFPTLTAGKTQDYSDAYFNSFNIIHPLLDYDSFMELAPFCYAKATHMKTPKRS